MVTITVDGAPVQVREGATLLEALRAHGVDTPTLCFLENLTPVNACRVCVVELQGARTLVPSCSRKAEEGMVVSTDSERVRHARKTVFELLGSSVDLSNCGPDVKRWSERYGADPARFGASAAPAPEGERDHAHPGHHHAPSGEAAQTVAQPVKIDNDLFVRDYSRCILCYKCVEACGEDAQNTFAIAVPSRRFVPCATAVSGLKQSSPSTSSDHASRYPSASISRASVGWPARGMSYGTDSANRFSNTRPPRRNARR